MVRDVQLIPWSVQREQSSYSAASCTDRDQRKRSIYGGPPYLNTSITLLSLEKYPSRSSKFQYDSLQS